MSSKSNHSFPLIKIGALILIHLKCGNAIFRVSNMEYLSSQIEDDDINPDFNKSLKRLDNYKILQSSLSKQFPPERYNGIVNMFYVSYYPNATSEEIESVVVSVLHS